MTNMKVNFNEVDISIEVPSDYGYMDTLSIPIPEGISYKTNESILSDNSDVSFELNSENNELNMTFQNDSIWSEQPQVFSTDSYINNFGGPRGTYIYCSEENFDKEDSYKYISVNPTNTFIDTEYTAYCVIVNDNGKPFKKNKKYKIDLSNFEENKKPCLLYTNADATHSFLSEPNGIYYLGIANTHMDELILYNPPIPDNEYQIVFGWQLPIDDFKDIYLYTTSNNLTDDAIINAYQYVNDSKRLKITIKDFNNTSNLYNNICDFYFKKYNTSNSIELNEKIKTVFDSNEDIDIDTITTSENLENTLVLPLNTFISKEEMENGIEYKGIYETNSIKSICISNQKTKEIENPKENVEYVLMTENGVNYLFSELSDMIANDNIKNIVLYCIYDNPNMPDLEEEMEDLPVISVVQVGPYDVEDSNHIVYSETKYYKVGENKSFEDVAVDSVGFKDENDVVKAKFELRDDCLVISFSQSAVETI